jgi:hypothetical protein
MQHNHWHCPPFRSKDEASQPQGTHCKVQLNQPGRASFPNRIGEFTAGVGPRHCCVAAEQPGMPDAFKSLPV